MTTINGSFKKARKPDSREDPSMSDNGSRNTSGVGAKPDDGWQGGREAGTARTCKCCGRSDPPQVPFLGRVIATAVVVSFCIILTVGTARLVVWILGIGA